ncbi:hypothetical protein FACS1894153_3910 [Bacteroidia bacterium]|nr:hypothetical protein FACS1894153_3910 [Bacteroidia bacterium]
MKIKYWLIFLTLIFIVFKGYSQKPPEDDNEMRDLLGGSIMTAVPFLLISPDAVSGSMGDIGVATAPDLYSQHWNPAKYPFIDSKTGFSLTYSPWLRSLVQDMHLLYLSGYYKLDERSAISGSLTFFSLGEILFTQSSQDAGTPYRPNEYAFDLAYSRSFTENFSMAIAGRYIRSDLTQGYVAPGQSSNHAAQSAAADVAFFYRKPVEIQGYKGSAYSIGLNITNIGAKVSYSEAARKDFLPTNLKLGGGYSLDFDDYNRLSIYLELNKLLVPTPPVMDNDTIVKGKSSDVGVMEGIIQSFSDAPGGFREELAEWSWSVGAEYKYTDILSFRGGYFHEAAEKGKRQYLTAGVGLKFNVITLDVSYLMPTAGGNASNPLKNTLRFSLGFNFGEYLRQNKK